MRSTLISAPGSALVPVDAVPQVVRDYRLRAAARRARAVDAAAAVTAGTPSGTRAS